jgi:organic hydroperoxide reductase OsmC/OhrA
MKTHSYTSHLMWDAGSQANPFSYATYSRKHRILVAAKPDLDLSSDPLFRGDGSKHNPEDLFVASLSSCHLLSYLAVCAREGVKIVAYEDNATGTMSIRPDGSGKFDEVTLRPVVTIAPDADEKRALELHDLAHKQCFIASSVSIPVRHEPIIRLGRR